MRQYRGLTKDGKWVYGWYIYRGCVPNDTHYIYSGGFHTEVIPETVGQQTDTTDKHKNPIYQGDTLKNSKDPRGNQLFDVAWSEMFHGWIGNSQTECLQMKPCMFDESEIVANIHQNLELLEKQK